MKLSNTLFIATLVMGSCFTSIPGNAGETSYWSNA